MISIYGSMSKNLQHSMPSSTSSTLHYSHSREIAQKSSFMHKKNNSILHPIAHSHLINGKKRGRTSSEDTLSSLSPNINGTIKRQRRKICTNIQSTLPSLVSLSPKPATKGANVSKRTKNRSRSKPKKRVLADNWSETDQSYSNSGDDDYIPPKNKTKCIQQKVIKNKNENDSDSDHSTPSGYRPLNWRKNEVATPKFVKISDANLHILSSQKRSLNRQKSTPNSLKNNVKMSNSKCLKRAHSVTDMTNHEVEDTSNEAYFYRHYRAEAREKLFYEQLFDQRLKQQQILEQKAKRKKKKNENEHSTEEHNHSNGNGHNNNNNDKDEIDLSLPTLPKGPWSFKLGPEYDSKPLVPSNVINRPQFNYDIPFKELQQRKFMNDDEKKAMENWWKMPSHLIRRTDYGNFASSKVCVEENVKKRKKRGRGRRKKVEDEEDDDRKDEVVDTKEDEAKKRELIQLYKLAKQAQRMEKKDGKKRHKKKNKHKRHKKEKEKNNKRRVFTGPVDVRMLLK